MIVRVIDADLDNWIAARVTPPRSEGHHVSAVLTDMLKSLPVKRYETWGKKRADDEREPMWENGYMWEDVLAKALADRPVPGCHLIPPWELELDGIFGTPDRLLVQTFPNGGHTIVDEEIKFTWMGCKTLLHDPKQRPARIEDWNAEGLTGDVKFTYWLLQSRTYAAMLFLGGYRSGFGKAGRLVSAHTPGATPIIYKDPDGAVRPPLVRLRAMFVNGAYMGPLAIPGGFEIEYTADELEVWWRNLRDHAHRMGTPATDEPPPF